MTLTTRQPMRSCGKRYASRDEALNSKLALAGGHGVVPCAYRCGGWHLERIQEVTEKPRKTPKDTGPSAKVRTPIRPVSAKRAAENRVRHAMAAAMFPGALNGGQERPLCAVYDLAQLHPGVVPAVVLGRCGRWADDLHEPLSRARGGSIVDPENAVPPCRPCHTAITPGPAWAERLGLVKHSGGGDAA